LPQAEYAKITGAMWPFRKRPGDLEPQVNMATTSYTPMRRSADLAQRITASA
jgi:hypothetical protein